MSKKTYYKVSILALGSLDGGSWEEDAISSGDTPKEAYDEALEYLRKKGYAYESKIELCDEHGDTFE